MGRGRLSKDRKSHLLRDPLILGTHTIGSGGRKIREFKSGNSWFRPITRDLPDPLDSHSVDIHMGRVVRNRSMVDNVLLLRHDLVMIQYHNGNRGIELQVFDETGQLITEILGLTDCVLHAYNGSAYRVVQPDVDEHGTLPNPYIAIYKHVAE